VLFLVGAWSNHSWAFADLLYNLFLAWVPLGLTIWLTRILQRRLWSHWQSLGVTLLWLCFLPNSFYMLTDFIHLQDYSRVDQIFDLIMFSSFILNAFVLGLISVYVVHAQLRWRMRDRNSTITLAGLLLATSFAIYIGRDLRWSTWDILFNPASLLFDISDRLLHPFSHPEMFTTTLGFFALIASIYAVAWYALRLVRQQKSMTVKQ